MLKLALMGDQDHRLAIDGQPGEKNPQAMQNPLPIILLLPKKRNAAPAKTMTWPQANE